MVPSISKKDNGKSKSQKRLGLVKFFVVSLIRINKLKTLGLIPEKGAFRE